MTDGETAQLHFVPTVGCGLWVGAGPTAHSCQRTAEPVYTYLQLTHQSAVSAQIDALMPFLLSIQYSSFFSCLCNNLLYVRACRSALTNADAGYSSIGSNHRTRKHGQVGCAQREITKATPVLKYYSRWIRSLKRSKKRSPSRHLREVPPLLAPDARTVPTSWQGFVAAAASGPNRAASWTPW